MRRNSSRASSYWGSWVPVQIPTAASLGASTVSTLDTASTVQGTPAQLPAAIRNSDPNVRQDIQETLRNALEALMEERRRQPQPTNRGERQVPQMPQLLQSLRGLPETAGVVAATPEYSVPRGLPMMFQQPPRLPALQDSGRQNAERPALPNITSLMLGSMQPTPGPLGLQASGNSAAQPSTIWGNPSQMIARSIALRRAANSSSSSGEVRPVLVPQASAAPVVAPADTEADRPPRDPLLVPDDGRFPLYEAELDPTHLTQAGKQGPGRERRA
jgi:hypothetical protein